MQASTIASSLLNAAFPLEHFQSAVNILSDTSDRYLSRIDELQAHIRACHDQRVVVGQQWTNLKETAESLLLFFQGIDKIETSVKTLHSTVLQLEKGVQGFHHIHDAIVKGKANPEDFAHLFVDDLQKVCSCIVKVTGPIETESQT
ncbi:hypothetical protein RCL1_006036 [Eukaryota sp. TZLM3-RCL]